MESSRADVDNGAAAAWRWFRKQREKKQKEHAGGIRRGEKNAFVKSATKIRPNVKRIIRRADDDVPKDAAQKETDNTVALVSKRVSLAKKWVKQTTTKDGIEVWTRENGTTENPIKEIRATVTFEDVSPLNFWRAVADLDEYAKFVPYVGHHKVLKTKGKLTDQSATFYVYGVVTAPVVKNRDYTIRIEAKRHQRGKSKGFESRWTLDTENVGPKPKKGVVRLLANDGGWTVQPSKKNQEDSLTANGVSVTYEILTDPGSNIPGWLIDKVNRASVPDVLRAMRKRALSGESMHILPDREGRRVGGIVRARFHLPHFGFLDVGTLRDVQRLESVADVVYRTSKTVAVKVNELFSEMNVQRILQR